MNSQLKKNLIYNVLYQILLLVLPFITVPYVSRVLGVDGIGIYSYTYSVVNYFMLVAMLGINNYGNRTIAKVRDNKDKLSKTFYSIYSIQFIMSILMIMLYLLYIVVFDVKYKSIAQLQIICLLSNMLDINWFFFGLEKFKLTVTRSTIVKIVSLIFIFLFVKQESDLWKYVLILSCSSLFSQLFLFTFLKKEINFIKITISDVLVHIKPILVLFIPVIAISVYKIMDKIMLGNMSVINEVGYYEQAEKIISIPLGIITALGTVMLPRISNLVQNKRDDQVRKYIHKSISFMMFLAFPICFGLISISKEFVLAFLGNGFMKSSVLLSYLSVTIVFLSFANVIRTEYLIPREMDNIYIVSVGLGAVINFVINLLLIPHLSSVGACIGTIAAEFIVMFYQIMAIRKELPVKDYILNSIPYFIKSFIMFIIIYLFNYINISNMIRLVLQVLLGCFIYFLLNIKYVLSIVDIKKYMRKLNKSN